jgi:DNA repair protein RadC
MLQKITAELKRKVTNAEALAGLGAALLAAESEIDRDKEHFWVIGLDTKLAVKYVDLCTLGVLDASLVHPREVFRLAVWKGVSAIAVMHNHPSGDVTPSAEDRRVTETLKKAGDLLGITLIDHVIVGNGSRSYMSYANGWSEMQMREPTAQVVAENRFVTPELFE